MANLSKMPLYAKPSEHMVPKITYHYNKKWFMLPLTSELTLIINTENKLIKWLVSLD